MAHHKSTKKRIKTNEKSRLYNRSLKSRVKTYTRYLEETLASFIKADDKEALKLKATEQLKKVVSELQKATSKGVIHKNTTSRKVGRLTKAFNKTFA